MLLARPGDNTFSACKPASQSACDFRVNSEGFFSDKENNVCSPHMCVLIPLRNICDFSVFQRFEILRKRRYKQLFFIILQKTSKNHVFVIKTTGVCSIQYVSSLLENNLFLCRELTYCMKKSACDQNTK